MSNIGNWAAATALALVIYAETGSAVWLSVAFLLTQLPSALVAPIGGVIADRLNRQRVMITCDLLGAACYVGLALVRSPAALIALGALAAVLHMPFGPASRAAVPNLVEGGDLSWANGTLAAAGNVGNLVGPALGGALYGLFGAHAVFWTDAASFVMSAGVIATVRGRFRAEPSETGGARGGMWDGARFVWRQRTLLTMTVVGAVTFVGTEVASVADLPLIKHFGVGGPGYGAMNTVWGAGGLVGGLVAARTITRTREPAAAVFGVLFLGVFVSAVGVSPWFALIPVFMFAFAFSDSFSFVGYNGIYQRGSPDEIRGRLFAAVGAVYTLGTAVSFAVAGFLVQAVGWRPVYVGGGLIDVGCALVLGFVLLRRPGTVPAPGPSHGRGAVGDPPTRGDTATS